MPKVEIYVDGRKNDEVELSTSAIELLFEEIDNIIFNEMIDNAEV